MRDLKYSILWDRMCHKGLWCGVSYIKCGGILMLVEMQEGSVLGEVPTEAEVRAVADLVVESRRLLIPDEAIRAEYATRDNIISAKEI
jgi:hypothetical protein